MRQKSLYSFAIEVPIFFALLAFNIFSGGEFVKIVRAQAPDGRIFRAVNGAYHVTRGAGDPAYYRDFNKVPFIDGGGAKTLDKPYKESVWVMSAINMVTQPLKSISLKFYRGDVEFENPELQAFWKKPALGMRRSEFIDATAGWWKLRGEFFWLLDDTWLSRSARKSPLIVARPDAMRAIVLGEELICWEFTTAKNKRLTFLPEQVIHEKRWNPYNPTRGLGELEAAILAASTDYAAAQFLHDTFANRGDQGEYIVAKGAMPTQEQRDQMIASLREKRMARHRGDFRPVLLAGDIDIKSPQIAAPDAAFAANRIQNRHEVFAAFGVPMSMADIQASYSIGSASDYFRLIFNTCQPLGATIAGAIDQVERRRSGIELETYFDWDEHPVMQAVRSERIDSAVKLAGQGMPMREINDYLDMGLPQFPGWEIGYLPFSVSPVGSPLTPPANEPESPAATQDDESVEAMIRALSNVRGCPAHGTVSKADGDKWQAHWRARQGTIKIYASKFNRELIKARGSVLQKLSGAKAKNITKAAASDFMFDAEDFESGIFQEMRKAGTEALKTAGKQAFLELGKDDPFTMPPAKALQFLSARENNFRDLTDDIHKQILGSLQEGILGGETTEELAARIRTEFNGISRERAMRVAMTETSAAYGSARQEAFEQSGIQFKKWLTSGNDNVRPSHQQANGQTVPINEPFIIAGAEIMHPGDGSLGAPLGEIINCHCVALASEKGPAV